jgi:hypothetical protein
MIFTVGIFYIPLVDIRRTKQFPNENKSLFCMAYLMQLSVFGRELKRG